MTQQTLINEGCFDQTLKDQVNDNFTELYSTTATNTANIATLTAGMPVIVRQSADVTATTNTTLANLTGLVQTVSAGTYNYRITLQTNSTGNGGTKVAFKYTTAALTSIQASVRASTATSPANSRFTTTTDQASIVAATVANLFIEIEGTMVVSTAGTIQVQGAQNASHSDTTTFYTGSSFTLTKIS